MSCALRTASVRCDVNSFNTSPAPSLELSAQIHRVLLRRKRTHGILDTVWGGVGLAALRLVPQVGALAVLMRVCSRGHELACLRDDSTAIHVVCPCHLHVALRQSP